MDRSLLRRASGSFDAVSKKSRRPAGVSRRRKKQLGFEQLEDRRVMSAQSPVAGLIGAVDGSLTHNVQSYSSATLDGQYQQFLSEMYWQSLIAAATGTATSGSKMIPSDPYFGNQWHLVNSGQQVGSPDWQTIFGVAGEDINVAPVYNQGLTGAGIRVAVIDSGVQLNHPDLAANIDLNLSYDVLNPFTGTGNPSFSLLTPDTAHGTAVAGLIGAVANNNEGGAGVAPGVTLVPIRLVDVGQSSETNITAFRYALQNGIDITNNSWGPSDALRTLAGPTARELQALREMVMFGRNGLGIINVWAAGNGGGPNFGRNGFPGIGAFDQSNYDGYANSRYTIAVGGVDHDGGYNNVDGTVTSYPEAGANVLVVAPTGSVFTTIGTDTGTGSGLVTTDLTGDFGFNRSPNPNTGEDFDRDYFDNTDYTSRFNGTSGSAPIVTGVIALMLEANPNLSWRDVQEILVRSARQNAQFEIPQNGAGSSTQNTWIINQVPVFHDPDIYSPNANPDDQTLRPTLDPNGVLPGGFYFDGRVLPSHHVGTPFALTNGAGYTVSQGRGAYNEMIGYGHGTVDAELAVAMAQQWSTKNQALPQELTYTTFVTDPGNTPENIPAAERGNLASGFQIVPGGIGGLSGFIDYWNEYYDATPFAPGEDHPFQRGDALAFSVPDSNTMSIESVDVKIAFDDASDPTEILNHVRILLVSPDGTHSDLNNYFVDLPPLPSTFQFLPLTEAVPLIGTPQIGGSGLDTFVWTFNTNRSWGERSDDALVIDPVTGEPVTITNPTFGTLGEALTQGWQLVIENWDINNSFGLAGVEVAWHGSPIAANSQRVQGFVGVDNNRDDQFNYSRVIQSVTDGDGNPATLQLGDVRTDIDLAQESFASNVTVTVRRTSDNALVDQFVTGHDGNFYFDLVPDDYTITVEDPLGRSALDDASTGAQFLRHFKTQWQISEDWFNAWDHDSNNAAEVLVDPNGTPVSWLNGNGQAEENGMRGINFLLDPGAAPAPQVQFQGTVYADTNGDGLMNSYDVSLPGVTVFGDVNRNGVRDSGEVATVTDATGKYTLVVPATQAGVINVGVQTPVGWTKSNPSDGLETFFVRPGNQLSGVDFRIQPPAVNNGGGGGASQPGILMGYVFEDSAGTVGDGVQQATEKGFGGITVYIDANNSGTLDAGDTSTVTNEFGAFAFGNVAPGQRILRTNVASPLVRTLPGNNSARTFNLVGSGTISGISFGVRNTATVDFGDLPNQYHATLSNDTAVSALGGARHAKSAYWLGSRVDFELNGSPSPNADGDDVTSIPDDEDGIEFVTPLAAGTTATIKATASRNNGYLQAWADWNNDGDFNDVGERIITNRLLYSDAAQNFVSFAVPASAGAQVYLRFRYGEYATAAKNINTPFGLADSGEVEDYLRTVPALPAVIVGTPGDFDQNDAVDGLDFLNWQRNMGRTTGASQSVGNANGDSVVDGSDLTQWSRDFGKTSTANLVIQTGDFDGDEDVDGADFLALQRGFGAAGGAFVTQGDSNGDRKIDATDVGVWTEAFGHVGLSTTQNSSSAAEAKSGHAQTAALTVVDADASTSASTADALPVGYDFSAKALDERAAVARRLSFATVAEAAWTTPTADYDFLRRDRAFDDLFGSRRRQGYRPDEASFESDNVSDADEAFAVLADHFEQPLG